MNTAALTKAAILTAKIEARTSMRKPFGHIFDLSASFTGRAGWCWDANLYPFADAYSLPGGLARTGSSLADEALREMGEEVQVCAQRIAFNCHVVPLDCDIAVASAVIL
jgi:hypothetical protein